MWKLRRWHIAVVLVAVTLGCADDGDSGSETDGGSASPPEATGTPDSATEVPRANPSVFEYDSSAELNVTEDPDPISASEADIHPIEYDSPAGGRVTGLIAHPAADQPEAAVVFIHGIPEAARHYVEPLAGFACAGATALVIDAPYVRAGRVDDPLTFTELDHEEQIQFIVDLRRAVDLLEASGAQRITVDATSWGAAIGALLAGVEPRVDGYALMAGGSPTEFFLRDGEPAFPLDQQPDDVIDTWLTQMDTIDPTRFIADATTPILFQHGRTDQTVTQQAAEALHDAAGPDHEVRWYDTGHEPNRNMLVDHIQWQADILELDTDQVDTCFEPLLPPEE